MYVFGASTYYKFTRYKSAINVMNRNNTRAPHGYGSIQVTRQVDPKYSGQVIKFMIQYQVRLQV